MLRLERDNYPRKRIAWPPLERSMFDHYISYGTTHLFPHGADDMQFTTRFVCERIAWEPHRA